MIQRSAGHSKVAGSQSTLLDFFFAFMYHSFKSGMGEIPAWMRNRCVLWLSLWLQPSTNLFHFSCSSLDLVWVGFLVILKLGKHLLGTSVFTYDKPLVLWQNSCCCFSLGKSCILTFGFVCPGRRGKGCAVLRFGGGFLFFLSLPMWGFPDRVHP